MRQSTAGPIDSGADLEPADRHAPGTIVVPAAELSRGAALVPGVVAAFLTVALVLKAQPSQHFSDPVSGSLAFGGGRKWGDLVALPLAVIVGVLVAVAVSAAVRAQDSPRRRRAMASQFLWWCCPGALAVGALIASLQLSVALASVTVGASLLMSAEVLLSRRGGRVLSPETVSASVLGCVLWALVPIAVAVAIGRTTAGLADLSDGVPWTLLAVAAGCAAAGIQLWVSARGPVALESGHRIFLALPQCFAPLLMLAFIPARLRLPHGSVAEYPTALALPALGWLVAVLGVAACVARLRRSSATLTSDLGVRVMTPFAVLPLLLVGMFGRTGVPIIPADDYHYGETLLGWLSYRSGHLPYVDYQPPHGLVQDDLASAISAAFFDGTAASHTEALRLSAALLAALLFTVVMWSTRSQLLAVLVTVVGVAPTVSGFSGTSWVFLAAVGWLLVAPRLRAVPTRWLTTWVLLTPVLVLAVPAQGLVLAAAAGALAVRSAGQVLRHDGLRGFMVPAVTALALLLVAAVTPLGRMLSAAVVYVVSNAGVNMSAYGIPWNPGLVGPGNTPVVLDVLRMLWVVGLVLCCTSALVALRAREWHGEVMARAVFFALFLGGVLPYVMGRVDAASPSRAGQATAFTLALVVPVLLWWRMRRRNRAVLALALVTCVTALFGPAFRIDDVTAASDPFVASGRLLDGASLGLPGWGRAAPQDPNNLHQTAHLGRILDESLRPGASYYDATSHNAQYFYLGRRPAVSVSADYNTPLPADQERTIRQLKQAAPEIAVLLQPMGNITFDGGGVALRTPLLARYLESAYVPYQEGGFILGSRDGQVPSTADRTVSLDVNAGVTDSDWDRGVSRTSSAVLLADPLATPMIVAGATVTLPDGSRARVTSAGAAVVHLDKSVPESAFAGAKRAITVDVDALDPRLYRAWLFERAFGQTDLSHLPASWGQSLDSMGGLRRVADLDAHGRLAPASALLSVPLPVGTAGSSEVDMVSFDVHCTGPEAGSPVMSLAWTSRELTPQEFPGRSFVAVPGRQLVPLDSSAFWRSTTSADALTVRLVNGGGCASVDVSHVSLWKRSG